MVTIHLNYLQIPRSHFNPAARKLLAKKLGFRIHMDLIPLDSHLVKGSHGIIPSNQSDWPILINPNSSGSAILDPTEIYNIILNQFLAT